MVDRSSSLGTLIYDPGADAATRFPDWTIRHKNLRGIPEVMCPVRKVILIEYHHCRAERRSDLAHAVAHIDLDHRVANGILSARQELAADKLAARRLIGIRFLADALMWAEGFEEAAHQLDVDERMLWVRFKHMHPSEGHWLRGAVGAKSFSA